MCDEQMHGFPNVCLALPRISADILHIMHNSLFGQRVWIGSLRDSKNGGGGRRSIPHWWSRPGAFSMVTVGSSLADFLSNLSICRNPVSVSRKCLPAEGGAEDTAQRHPLAPSLSTSSIVDPSLKRGWNWLLRICLLQK